MKRIIIFTKTIAAALLLFAVYAPIKAQDFHLSHFDANPLYLNPALTGCRLNQEWDYRVNTNYRAQWKKLMNKPYATVATGFDMPFKDKFSTGILIIDNKAITGAFNTLNVLLSGSYNITHASIDKKHSMLVGLQAGFIQKSYNPGNYVYESQYSPSASDYFDESINSGENYLREKLLKFDANVGIYYKLMDETKKYSPFGGFSIYHFTKPNESFTGRKSKLPMRFTLHGGCDYKINDVVTVLPQFLYMNQAKATELNIGTLVFYKIKDTDYEPLLGAAWRMKDAIAIHAGLKLKNNYFRISYDVNTSYLNNYSSGRGGFEFSVIYTGKMKTPRVAMPSI